MNPDVLDALIDKQYHGVVIIGTGLGHVNLEMYPALERAQEEEIPIVMVVLTLTLDYPMIRWLSLVAAGFLFVFNLIGVHTYPGAYDKFLIIVGLGFNALTIWYAWMWT